MEPTITAQEDAIVAEIYQSCKQIWKASDKFQFPELESMLERLETTLRRGAKLPTSNPAPEDYQNYPQLKNGDYQLRRANDDVIKQIESLMDNYKCACAPHQKCVCSPTEPAEIRVNGTSCFFCGEVLARFSSGYWLEEANGKGFTVCAICNRELFTRLYPDRALAKDLRDLTTDAYDESRYLQFDKAVKLVHSARERLRHRS